MPPKRLRPEENDPEIDSDGNDNNSQNYIPHAKKRIKYTTVLLIQPIQQRGTTERHQAIHLTVEPDFAPVSQNQHHGRNEIIFHIFNDSRSATTTTVRIDGCAVPAEIRSEAIPPRHEPQWVWHLIGEEEENEDDGNKWGTAVRAGDLTTFDETDNLGTGKPIDHITNHHEDNDENNDEDDPWAAEPGPHIDMPQTRDGGTEKGTDNREVSLGESAGERWKQQRREELLIGALLGLIVTWINILIIVF
ncbi:hypothetical protein F5X99DRAFT_401826, partial [Biscogniauxia marginata]